MIARTSYRVGSPLGSLTFVGPARNHRDGRPSTSVCSARRAREYAGKLSARRRHVLGDAA